MAGSAGHASRHSVGVNPFFGLGPSRQARPDAAFAWLERAYGQRDASLSEIKIEFCRRPAEATTLMSDVPTPQWVRLAGASSWLGALGSKEERSVSGRL